MPESPQHEIPIRIFVSYAREDRRWIDPEHHYTLVPFLEASLRRYNVTFWYDRALQPGDEFKRFIEKEIDKSQIALLLVSQSFLNSEFIEEREMPRIYERSRTGEMIVIPVLVGPCKWSDYPFLADRQMVPAANPLIKYTQSEAQWEDVKYEILEGIHEQVKRMRDAIADKHRAEEERIATIQKAQQNNESAAQAEAELKSRQAEEAAAKLAHEQAQAQRNLEEKERLQRKASSEAAKLQADLESKRQLANKLVTAPDKGSHVVPTHEVKPKTAKTTDEIAVHVSLLNRPKTIAAIAFAVFIIFSLFAFFYFEYDSSQQHNNPGLQEAQRGCDSGFPGACNVVGNYYYEGDGKNEPNALTKAAYAYKLACPFTGDACDKLGHMYLQAQGVAFDSDQALNKFGNACDSSSMSRSDGCAYWAQLYIQTKANKTQPGQLMSRPSADELSYARKFCSAGDLESCAAIGASFEYELGVSQDIPSAIAFYKKACPDVKFVKFACDALSRLSSQ